MQAGRKNPDRRQQRWSPGPGALPAHLLRHLRAAGGEVGGGRPTSDSRPNTDDRGMRHPLKFILWVLPVLGFVLGYAYAYVFFHGLLETWHFVGKPDENIVRIYGIRDARKLLVATETGNIYSLEFGKISFNGFYYEGKSLSHPNRRGKKKSMILSILLHPLQYYGADFFTWPPLFQVVQLYEAAYLYKYEGKGRSQVCFSGRWKFMDVESPN